MAETFQQKIDEALQPIAAQGKWGHGMAMTIPMNEDKDQAVILARLAERIPSQSLRRVHIGVAGFFNFEIAAITRPQAILLLDVNEDQTRLWRAIVGLLRECVTPEEFRQTLLERCENPSPSLHFTSFRTGEDLIPMRYGSESHQHYFDTRLPNWLRDPEAYSHLRQLALEGKIASATINLITDGHRAAALHKIISAQGFTTDTCYLSNIGGVLLHEHKAPEFKKLQGMAGLISGQTGMHMFTRSGSEGELLITEGSLRNLARVEARRAKAAAQEIQK